MFVAEGSLGPFGTERQLGDDVLCAAMGTARTPTAGGVPDERAP
jgi:hypothetical protein